MLSWGGSRGETRFVLLAELGKTKHFRPACLAREPVRSCITFCRVSIVRRQGEPEELTHRKTLLFKGTEKKGLGKIMAKISKD